jgi:hypothetical protein
MSEDAKYLEGDEEVKASDPWDYFITLDPRVGAELRFWREKSEVVEILPAAVRVDIKRTEWMTAEEPTAELRALMVAWRAKGWGDYADAVETQTCNDDYCSSGASVYDEIGSYHDFVETRLFPLAECRFYKMRTGLSFFQRLMMDSLSSSPAARFAPLVGLSATGLGALGGAILGADAEVAASILNTPGYKLPARRVKLARRDSRTGALTAAEEVSVGEDGEIIFIEYHEAEPGDIFYMSWVIYVPLHGFEANPDAVFYQYSEVLVGLAEKFEGRKLRVAYHDSELHAELCPKDEPETNGGTDEGVVFACTVSLVDCPRCGADKGHACTTLPGVPSVTLFQPHRERMEAAEGFGSALGGNCPNPCKCGPEIRNTPGHYYAYHRDEVLNIRGRDIRTSLKLDPNPGPNAMAAGDEDGTWDCTNHPAGLEITYPATTPKCEVCGEVRP